MRILVPAYLYEDSFADNVQHTLTQMGHEVRTLGFIEHRKQMSSRHRAAIVLRNAVFGDRPGETDRKILKVAAEFKPDLVLAMTASLHSETLQKLGRIARMGRVLWWGDPPANSQRWGIVDPGWDFIYTKDRVAVAKLRVIGRNAHLLHESMNPDWHKPVASNRNSDVVIAGNYYAFRQALTLRLLDNKISVQLHGLPPPAWADAKIKQLHSGRYIVRSEKSTVFGEALACLNSFSLAEGDSLNCRAFEIAGAAGLQIIEYRPAVTECFEPGKELLAFSTFEELIDCIGRARRSPSDLDRIREAGARRAQSEHTYEQRLRVILDNLN